MSDWRIEETRGRVRVVSEALTDGSRVYSVEIFIQPQQPGAAGWVDLTPAVTEQHAYMAMDCICTGLQVAQGERTNLDRQGARP